MAYHPFPQTRWTMVISAKEGEAEASFAALEELAKAYWHPVHAYLRSRGLSPADTHDATQGFFAYLLGRDFLRNIEPEGGRFRNFLLVALRRWMKDQRERAVNVKRAAEIEWQPWHEAEAAELALSPVAASPEEAFDRSWAEELVSRSMRALKQRWEGRAALFEALRITIDGSDIAEKYAVIATRLGMSEGAVGKAAHDLRRQFAEQIRKEIRDTVARDQDVEEELRYLVHLMRG